MIYLASNDIELIKSVTDICSELKEEFESLNKEEDSCEIVTRICSSRPKLIVVDDDCSIFDAQKLIPSVRSLCGELPIVFFTSDGSVDRGSTIVQHKINYYGIKPISKFELFEVIKSILIHNQSLLNNKES